MPLPTWSTPQSWLAPKLPRERGVSMGADMKANTQGGGALELGDLRLLEDCGERGGALGSDAVAFETASEGWDGDGERVGVSMGADRMANTRQPV